MKKISIVLLFLISLVCLTGCYKQDTYDFVEGNYILENKENEEFAFDNYKLDNVVLSFKEIDKETYDSNQMKNVLENRYSKKYYSVTFSMTIEGIEYNDIKYTEIPGSSNYNNRYNFKMALIHNEKEYDCIFRFDISNFNGLYQVDDDQANHFYCDILMRYEKEGEIYSGSKIAHFGLNYTNNDINNSTKE